MPDKSIAAFVYGSGQMEYFSFENVYYGTSSSGKTTAFGAVIPQVRILSSQKIENFVYL